MPNNLLVAAFICRVVTVRSDWSVVSIFDPLGTSELVRVFNHAPAMEPQVSIFAWLGNQVGWTGRLATTAPGSTTLGEPTAPFTDSPLRAPRLVLIFVESSITAVNEPYSPDPLGILVHWTMCPGPFRDKFNLSLGTECGLMAGVICKGLILWASVFLSAPQRTTGLLELIPCHLERTRSV